MESPQNKSVIGDVISPELAKRLKAYHERVSGLSGEDHLDPPFQPHKPEIDGRQAKPGNTPGVTG